MIITFNSWSQQFSKHGRFSIDYKTGCAPVTVNISEYDNFGNISRQYYYESERIGTLDTFHTFQNPGTYRIVQFLGVDVIPKSDTLVFEVLPDISPEFQIYRCSDNQALISIVDSRFQYFSVHFSETDSVIYYPGQPDIHHDFNRDFGIVMVRGYLENGFPTCPDKTISFSLKRESQIELVEAEIIEPCKDDPYVRLDIDNIDPNDFYQISIHDNTQSDILYEGAISGNQMYLPTGLKYNKENNEVCVELKTLNACNREIIYTTTYCFTKKEVRQIQNAYATFASNRVLLKLPETTLGSYEIFRKSDQSESYHFYGMSSSDFSDQKPFLGEHTYKVIQKDTCGYNIDSVFIAAPIIKLEDIFYGENKIEISSLNPQNSFHLSDSDLLFFSMDSSKSVSESISSNIDLPGGLDTEIKIRARYIYQDSISILSNELKVKYEYKVFVPEAFTPNNDGLNDQLEIFGLPTSAFEFQIFDSWGKMIQKTSDNPVWNGKIEGKKAPEGTYMYRIKFMLQSGAQLSQVGTFVLLRN